MILSYLYSVERNKEYFEMLIQKVKLVKALVNYIPPDTSMIRELNLCRLSGGNNLKKIIMKHLSFIIIELLIVVALCVCVNCGGALLYFGSMLCIGAMVLAVFCVYGLNDNKE